MTRTEPNFSPCSPGGRQRAGTDPAARGEWYPTEKQKHQSVEVQRMGRGEKGTLGGSKPCHKRAEIPPDLPRVARPSVKMPTAIFTRSPGGRGCSGVSLPISQPKAFDTRL